MPRYRTDIETIDEGDVDVYHPECRERILITAVQFRRDKDTTRLHVAGICKRCGRYVHLQLRSDKLRLTGELP